jgi:ERCC4-type nuclease
MTPVQFDPSAPTIQVSKPQSRLARRLATAGVATLPILEDEGPVERYVLSDRLAVDRRTGSGLLNGIMDKTLFTSAIYLQEHFALPVLLLEGQVNYEYRGFDPQAVRGALSSMVLEYGLSVLTSADEDDSLELLMMMARQEQVGIPEISLVPKRKATSLADMQRRVVEMLPGCGRVMARELLQHFGSVERITRATAAELAEIRGIGAKTAVGMVDVLAAEYQSVDLECQIEDAIVARPELLFSETVEVASRQLHIYDDEEERHIVDLVCICAATHELILVELKRDKLQPAHREQLRRYLDHAHESPVLRGFLECDYALRGVLASPEIGDLKAKYDDITIRAIDAAGVIRWLVQQRRQRQQ